MAESNQIEDEFLTWTETCNSCSVEQRRSTTTSYDFQNIQIQPVWMLKIHQVPYVTLWLVEDGSSLYWWVVEPKTPNQAFKFAWWLMVHSFLICCYVGLLWREVWICCEGFSVNKITTADSKREYPGNQQEQHKMNSDKLEKIKEDLMKKGEDYPSKTCIMEWTI